MVLVWRITDDSPNSPNFPAIRYMVYWQGECAKSHHWHPALSTPELLLVELMIIWHMIVGEFLSEHNNVDISNQILLMALGQLPHLTSRAVPIPIFTILVSEYMWWFILILFTWVLVVNLAITDRAKKTRSLVWAYFSLYDNDNAKVICKVCNKEFLEVMLLLSRLTLKIWESIYYNSSPRKKLVLLILPLANGLYLFNWLHCYVLLRSFPVSLNMLMSVSVSSFQELDYFWSMLASQLWMKRIQLLKLFIKNKNRL